MKFVVGKNNLGAQILNKGPDPPEKTASMQATIYGFPLAPESAGPFLIFLSVKHCKFLFISSPIEPDWVGPTQPCIIIRYI